MAKKSTDSSKKINKPAASVKKPAAKKSTPTKKATAAAKTTADVPSKQDVLKSVAAIKTFIKIIVSVSALVIVGGLVWIMVTQLTLTPSERVAGAFRDATRQDSYQVEFEISGSSGDTSSTLTGQAMIDDELSLTSHSALIDELDFSFDVFRNASEDNPQTLTRYNNQDIFVTQLGLNKQEADNADFSGVVDVWVASAGQTPFIDVAQTISSVNLADTPWEDGIVDAEQTDKTKQFAGRDTVGYKVKIKPAVVRDNLKSLEGDDKTELLTTYGVPVDADVSAEQYDQFLDQVVSSYERINESNLTVWLDGSRLVAITSEDVIVQNSQFDSIKLVFSAFGQAVNVEPVAEEDTISQQQFIERLTKLQPELGQPQDQPAEVAPEDN